MSKWSFLPFDNFVSKWSKWFWIISEKHFISKWYHFTLRKTIFNAILNNSEHSHLGAVWKLFSWPSIILQDNHSFWIHRDHHTFLVWDPWPGACFGDLLARWGPFGLPFRPGGIHLAGNCLFPDNHLLKQFSILRSAGRIEKRLALNNNFWFQLLFIFWGSGHSIEKRKIVYQTDCSYFTNVQ